MTSRAKQQVVAHGHNIRSTVLNAHVNWDGNFGREVLRRSFYDLAMLGADMHGAKAISLMLYAQADRLIRGDETAPDLMLTVEEMSDEEEVAQVVPVAAPPAPTKSPFIADLAALAENRILLTSALLAVFFAGIVVGAAA